MCEQTLLNSFLAGKNEIRKAIKKHFTFFLSVQKLGLVWIRRIKRCRNYISLYVLFLSVLFSPGNAVFCPKRQSRLRIVLKQTIFYVYDGLMECWPIADAPLEVMQMQCSSCCYNGTYISNARVTDSGRCQRKFFETPKTPWVKKFSSLYDWWKKWQNLLWTMPFLSWLSWRLRYSRWV